MFLPFRHGAILLGAVSPCVSVGSGDPWFEPRTTLRITNRQFRAALWLWFGAPGRIRTCDTRFRKPMLYPLSYEG